MAGDKRTVLSTKRARDRRQRAQRRASNKLELEGAAPVLATLTAAPLEPLLAVRVQLDDAAPHGALETPSVMPLRDSPRDDDASDEDDEDDEELVIVCRATLPDFCTRFMSPEHLESRARAGDDGRLCAFTASIPSFRETSDGFTTYTITLATCCEPQQHFALERRFSEFVALAAALRDDDGGRDAAGPASDSCSESDGAAGAPVAGAAATGQETETHCGFEWELPPKTWFKVTQLPALEERRQQLEQSLVRLLEQQAMSRRALVRDFLMLDIFGAQVADEKRWRAGE
ncbi:hypothetical protein PybrP1_009559 [[Pythium] brassicae (nom. inval.)]|nr:hypothetical protein PybrP1_009559 [[Pythium] brassicae (nom. inval.)]